jgi:hypothetical protein
LPTDASSSSSTLTSSPDPPNKKTKTNKKINTPDEEFKAAYAAATLDITLDVKQYWNRVAAKFNEMYPQSPRNADSFRKSYSKTWGSEVARLQELHGKEKSEAPLEDYILSNWQKPTTPNLTHIRYLVILNGKKKPGKEKKKSQQLKISQSGSLN